MDVRDLRTELRGRLPLACLLVHGVDCLEHGLPRPVCLILPRGQGVQPVRFGILINGFEGHQAVGGLRLFVVLELEARLPLDYHGFFLLNIQLDQLGVSHHHV